MYAIYPIIIAIIGALTSRTIRRDEDLQLPITLIISAYNEQEVIREKLENSLELDYPRHMLEIVVASESIDRTNDIVRDYSERGIFLRAFGNRLGKSATLFRTVPSAAGEILVFSDANTMYRRDSLRKLVRNFADESVGCVIGRLVYRDPSESVGGRGETLYWRFDNWQRRHAARATGLIPGINGGIFAIRRSLYMPFSEERGDDYELCTRIGNHGYDVLFESEAVAEEHASETTRQQFRRKTRLVRWNIASSLLLIRDALNCGNLRIAWQLVSHRLLRYTVPVWLLVALGASAWLAAESTVFALMLAAQLLFYGVGLLGCVAEAAKLKLPSICLLPSYFLMVNSAAMLAILALTRGQVTTWQKQR